MPQLNEIIHQPVRLQIMAALVTLEPGEQVDFSYLRKLLNLTDGNLGAHLAKLEEAGYIKIEKTFVARKPRTFISAKGRGRDAFTEHIAALRQIIAGRKNIGLDKEKRK
jgi:DNA-binding MarR family transcriptional regulator